MMNNEMSVAQLEAVIVKSSADETAGINLSAAIRAALVKFDGKKITARMQTAVEAAFPGACVSYRNDRFYCTISIWGGSTGRPMNSGFTVYFGGYDQPIFTLAEYDRKNTCCGQAAVERNAGRARILARPELLKAVAYAANALRRSAEALQQAMTNVAAVADKTFSTSDIERVVNAFIEVK